MTPFKYESGTTSELTPVPDLKPATPEVHALLSVHKPTHEKIAPTVKSGQRVIIAAHGNTLRALVKHLDNLTEEQVLKLNIPTGIPLVYELDENLKPLKSYYLGDQEAIAAAMNAVASQGKAKA